MRSFKALRGTLAHQVFSVSKVAVTSNRTSKLAWTQPSGLGLLLVQVYECAPLVVGHPELEDLVAALHEELEEEFHPVLELPEVNAA